VRFQPLHGPLSTRLVLLVGVPAALFLIGVLIWVATHNFNQSVDQTRASALDLARLQAARLDRILGEAARIPELHAHMLESGALKSPDELQRYLTQVVARNSSIYGSCLAFEPHTFVPDREYYAPYCYWKNGQVESTDIGTPEYNPFRWEWYAKPKATHQALWTEPYFDEGGGNTLMTTHSVPFHKAGTKGTAEDFLGIATIDISLDQLIRDLQDMRVAQTGYAFLVSPAGRYLAFPDTTRTMKGMIQNDNAELAAAMMSKSEGFIRTSEPWRSQDAWVAHMPVQNGGFTLGLVYPHAEIISAARRSLQKLVAVGVVGLAALFAILVFTARSVSRPITQLAAATRKIAAGDLDHSLTGEVRINEVRDLRLAFHKMTRDLRMRMEELKYTTTLTERMTGELNAARRIQMSMLPKEWSAAGAAPGVHVSLHAVIQPAREVGGDFYDYRFLDQDRLSILIGDVSGKGVPAALFMAMTQTLFKGFASPARTAADIMSRVNNALCDESHTGMFVTLIYGVLDVRRGMLELCNAGHPPPIHLRHRMPPQLLQGERHPALGLLRDSPFTSAHFQIQPGDRLVLYTDGVTESINAAHELYGSARLEQLLQRHAESSAAEITEAVIRDVRAHSGEQEPSDDLTILALHHEGARGDPPTG
jgi:sigma-B regulation protein RsbU (phosphoserine phosphatase)